MAKLKLNDASLIYEKDSSVALGYGFRCGFLGLLHLEIVQERLEREFEMSIVFTAPSVQYRLTLQGGEVILIDNPANYPDPSQIEQAEEPFISASMITPATYLGNIITLCLEKRGVQKSMTYLDEKRVELVFEMPLGEVVFDFYDRLKSVSRGYASLRLPAARVPRHAARQAGHPHQRQDGGRPLPARLPRQRLPDGAARVRAAAGRDSRASSSRSPSRAPSAARSSPGRRSTRSARTSRPSATAVTSPASGSSWRSRRKARSG